MASGLRAEKDDLGTRRRRQRQFWEGEGRISDWDRRRRGGSSLRRGTRCGDASLRGRVFGRVVAAGQCQGDGQGNGRGYGNAKQVALRVSVRQVWGTSD